MPIQKATHINIQKEHLIWNWGWMIIAVAALLFIIVVETFHLCEHSVKDIQVWHILLSLSYSYVAASVFHLIVVYLPHRRRKKYVSLYFKAKLFSISDKLRICKDTVLSPSCMRKQMSKEEFVQIFSEANLHEKSFIDKRISKLQVLKVLRQKIIDDVTDIYAYIDYLDKEELSLLTEVLNSEFIRNGIDALPDVEVQDRIGYTCNQREIGKCIYELNETMRIFIYNIKSVES